MKNIHWIFMILLLLLTSSCLVRFSYKKNRKSLQYADLGTVGKDDTLYVQNSFMCRFYRYTLFDAGERGHVDSKRTWDHFHTAMEALPLPLVFQSPAEDTCDNSLALNHRLREEQINLDDIRSWGQVQPDDKLRLVPIIHHTTAIRSMNYRDNFLYLHVYIFRGEELVFSRGMYYVAEVEAVEAFDTVTPVSVLEQKHWNMLTRLVMKPYVEEVEG